MPLFISLVAAPAVQNASEKGLFGKPYVRLGRLYAAIGMWVYQQGGALGYRLTGHPEILGKLLEAPPNQAAEYVQSLRQTAHSTLEQVEGREKTFHYLYTDRELRATGIDMTSWPPSKVLEKKCNAEMASDVMMHSFHEGAGLGFHFRDAFKEYWDNTYRLRPDSEWQEVRSHGLQLSETQQERPLGAAVAELAETAVVWANAEAPGLLSDSEISVLNRLSASAG